MTSNKFVLNSHYFFLLAMAHPHVSHNEVNMIQNSQRLLASGEIHDPIEWLRQICLARGFSGILGFGRCFRELHKSGTKYVNFHMFDKAINDSTIELPEGLTTAEIFNRFDEEGTGEVCICNMLDQIRVG